MTNRTLIEIMEEMKGEICNQVELGESSRSQLEDSGDLTVFRNLRSIKQYLHQYKWTISDIKTGKIFMLDGIGFFKLSPLDESIAKYFNIIDINTNDVIIDSINGSNTKFGDILCKFSLNRLLDEKGGPYCSKKEIEDMLYQNFYLMYKN